MQRNFVTIVSGPPRSGTSLLMQMLAAGGLPLLSDGRRVADAGNPRGYHELEAVKRLPRDAAWLADAEGRAVKVVHPPVAHLPTGFAYRVLWLERDLLEVARSQRVLLERLGSPPQDDLSDARVAQILARQLRETVAALDSRSDVERLRILHHELVAKPAEVAARIEVFLGGGLDRDAMAACVEPALHRERRSADDQ